MKLPTEPVSFVLPPPANLVSWQEHPQAKEITEVSNSWALETLISLYPSQEALEAFLQTNACWWTCIGYPSVDAERLLVYHKLTQYWFALDDLISYPDKPISQRISPSELFYAITEVMHGRAPPNLPPCVLPFVDLWGQMAPNMAPSVRERYVSDIEHMFNGFAKEAVLRLSGGPINEDEYMQVRRQTIGLRQCITFIEYGLGIDLSDTFAAHPSLTTACGLAIEQMIFFHEILSFRKEYYSGDMMNIITIWAGDNLSQLQCAVDRAHGAAIKAEKEFVALRDDICASEWGTSDVQRFLREIGHLMAGGLHIEYTSTRYHGIGHVWNGSPSGTLILTPERTIFTKDVERCRFDLDECSVRSLQPANLV